MEYGLSSADVVPPMSEHFYASAELANIVSRCWPHLYRDESRSDAGLGIIAIRKV